MALSDFAAVEVGEGQPSRLIASVWGREKQGKTDFALSAPEPIYVFNFDRGLDGPIRRYKGKQILQRTYRDSTLGATNDHAKLYDRFLSDLRDSVKHLDSGTVVIDTASHVWTLIQSVYVDEIRKQREEQGRKLMSFDYALANRHFREVIETVKDNPWINVVLINKAQELYDSKGQRLGVFEPQQNKDVPYLVDIVIRAERAEDGKFQVVIDSSRYQGSGGMNVEGMVISDPSWDQVAALLG